MVQGCRRIAPRIRLACTKSVQDRMVLAPKPGWRTQPSRTRNSFGENSGARRCGIVAPLDPPLPAGLFCDLPATPKIAVPVSRPVQAEPVLTFYAGGPHLLGPRETARGTSTLARPPAGPGRDSTACPPGVLYLPPQGGGLGGRAHSPAAAPLNGEAYALADRPRRVESGPHCWSLGLPNSRWLVSGVSSGLRGARICTA